MEMNEIEVTWTDEDAAEAEEFGWIPPERADRMPSGKQYVGPAEFLERNPVYRKYKAQQDQLAKIQAEQQTLMEHYKNVQKVEQTRADREIERRVAELKKEKVSALENEDHSRVVEIDDEIQQARSERGTAQQTPVGNPDFPAWASENPWYGEDKILTARGNVLGELLIQQGVPANRTLLDEVKKELMLEFPHKFRARSKAPMVEAGSGALSSGEGVKKKSLSVKDLTSTEREVYDTFAGMGIFKTADDEEKYLREVLEQRQ